MRVLGSGGSGLLLAGLGCFLGSAGAKGVRMSGAAFGVFARF